MSEHDETSFDGLDEISDLEAYMAEFGKTLGVKYTHDNPPVWLQPLLESIVEVTKGRHPDELQDVEEAPPFLMNGVLDMFNYCDCRVSTEGGSCQAGAEACDNCARNEHLGHDATLTLTLDTHSWIMISQLIMSAAALVKDTGPLGVQMMGLGGLDHPRIQGVEEQMLAGEDVAYPDPVTESQHLMQYLSGLLVVIRAGLGFAPGTVLD